MTSIELKHQARLQEWGSAIKECRSSGQSVREWCRQQGITPTTYYRWEREVLSVADSMAQQDGQESVTFAKSACTKTVIPERSGTFRYAVCWECENRYLSVVWEGSAENID